MKHSSNVHDGQHSGDPHTSDAEGASVADQEQDKIDLEILQPSGSSLMVSVARDSTVVEIKEMLVRMLPASVSVSQLHLAIGDFNLNETSDLTVDTLALRQLDQISLVISMPALTLNGRPIEPELHGAFMRGGSIFLGDGYFDVPASVLGSWGLDDFAVELTIGPNEEAWGAGHQSGGALFIRSDEWAYPYTGPTAFVNEDASIQFRMRHDRDAGTHRMISQPGVLTHDLNQPWPLQEHRLLFEKRGLTLTISVDGEVQDTMTMAGKVDINKWRSAPLRFLANHQDPSKQRIGVTLQHIELRGDFKLD